MRKKLSWKKEMAAYNKTKLVADVLATLKAAGYPVQGAVVSELVEVVFASLQTALITRGGISLPGIGGLAIELVGDENRPDYHFTPSPELSRRLRSALAD